MLDHLERDRLLAILRGTDAVALAEAATALVGAGVRTLEVSLSTDAGLPALAKCARSLPAEAALGAGTVIDAASADAAVAAGATFLVTPAVVPDVLDRARALGVPVICGALTPTEILMAWRAGAAAVKVFPASAFGPRYLAEVAAPLPDVPLVPVGGVRVEDVSAYLTAGALAVGVGSPLLGDAGSGGSLDDLRSRARDYLSTVTEAASSCRAEGGSGAVGV